MNILGLVFSLMLILSYTLYACWDKQTASHRLRKTYISYEKVHRKLLNSYQSEIYAGLGKRAAGRVADPDTLEIEDKETTPPVPSPPPKPGPNPLCARLNIWPLMQEGREAHPCLYETIAQMLRVLYPTLLTEKRAEYKFLDDLIASAKVAVQKEQVFALEKVPLSTHQRTYYKMLRGTKEWDVPKQIGYPTLLDYLKADPNPSQVCLAHAHPDVFVFLFNAEVAAHIYPEIHRKEGPPLTQPLLEKCCAEAKFFHPEPELIALLDFKHLDDKAMKKTLVAHEDQLSIRKTVFIPHSH